MLASSLIVTHTYDLTFDSFLVERLKLEAVLWKMYCLDGCLSGKRQSNLYRSWSKSHFWLLFCVIFSCYRAFTIISTEYSGTRLKKLQLNVWRKGVEMELLECSHRSWWLLYLGNSFLLVSIFDNLLTIEVSVLDISDFLIKLILEVAWGNCWYLCCVCIISKVHMFLLYSVPHGLWQEFCYKVLT